MLSMTQIGIAILSGQRCGIAQTLQLVDQRGLEIALTGFVAGFAQGFALEGQREEQKGYEDEVFEHHRSLGDKDEGIRHIDSRSA